MNQSDRVLRIYAESGLRTAADWTLLGRDIPTGVKPRLDTPHNGATISLYTRDQTNLRPRTRQK
jgi:hypothetical protein